MRLTDNHARAMTLIETVLTVSVLSVGLFLVVGWMSTLREDAKHDLTVRMLADLDNALARYRRATGVYPPSRGPESAISAVVDLLDHEKSCPVIEAFPHSLRKGPNRYNLIDSWGTPLRYLGPDSTDPKVLANAGRPVFISAGPDRDFGDSEPARLGDNLRSDDPGPRGFRIHDLRDAMVDEESTTSEIKKDN
ncbi:MAG TPA: type II secretion system protein [Phycisphaerae bacterium]|nr:type II secretion system protein [Phycisphaerae bacterium]HRW54158.1 type II secretion system protein [Phycisphaerae bacterium]